MEIKREGRWVQNLAILNNLLKSKNEKRSSRNSMSLFIFAIYNESSPFIMGFPSHSKQKS